VLASRTGKSETEILKEEVKAEKPKVSSVGWVGVVAVLCLREVPGQTNAWAVVAAAAANGWLS
jgi:hypothetical protein